MYVRGYCHNATMVFVYIMKNYPLADFEYDGGAGGRWWCRTLVVHHDGGAQDFLIFTKPDPLVPEVPWNLHTFRP